MQTTDLNGSRDQTEIIAPLYQSQAEQPAGAPESGLQNCEPADKCCLCLPIKCAMLFVCVGNLFSFLGYIVMIQIYNIVSPINDGMSLVESNL